MSDVSGTYPLAKATLSNFRSSWKALALTDLTFKLIAFVLLTPVASILFRVLIALSGRAVLSDVDMVTFFLGPIGAICGLLLGAIWLGIVALEQASLTGIVYARSMNRRLGVLHALRFAGIKAWPILQVTARIVGRVLLVAAPLLVIAGVVYSTLLTEYDINYYLQERPPAFKLAIGIGGLLTLILVLVLGRLVTDWFFALPLVLFENTRPSQALRRSSERADGNRLRILKWVVGWLAATLVASALVTGVIGMAGRLLIPDATLSLHWLVGVIGVALLVWGFASLVVNLWSTTAFATILYTLYQQLGSPAQHDLALQIGNGSNDVAGLRITRRRLFVAGVIGVLFAGAIGVLAVRTVRLEDDVLIMAHRGASRAAPENTLAAIRQAIQDGADWVEIDVQETADGHVVVLHDSDFMKLASQDLKIWNATLDDLQQIDIGSWFAPEFSQERVPTLDDVLDECKGKVGVNIELKYYGHDQQLEKRVAEIVEAHEMASEIMLMSLKMNGVLKMKEIRPDWKVGLLMSVSAGNLKQLEADFLAVNASFVDRRMIRTAHRSGKKVYVWTVNDAPTMSLMISRGVDGLLTDRPALARSVLGQRAQMSVPERLLLELAGVFGSVPEIAEQ